MVSFQKVGGLNFLKIGQLTVSWSMTKNRPALFRAGDVAKIAAIYVGVMVPLLTLI